MAKKLQPIVVKRYRREKDYQRDAQKMVQQGYRIAHVVSEQPPIGCGRFLLYGIFAFFAKPKPETVVTYELVV